MKKRMMGVVLSLTTMGMVLPALAAAPGPTTHSCTLKNQVYFAWTLNHDAAVELCKVDNGFRYSYGAINFPDTSIFQPTKNVKLSGGAGGGFSFKNGSILYRVVVDKHGAAVLESSHGEKIFPTIPLDTKWGVSVNHTFSVLKR